MSLPSISPGAADENLARLRLATALFGTTPDDLVEPVLDAAGEDAAIAYNSGALPELSDAAAHDTLHDHAEQHAARINQRELDAQLAYLLEVNDYDTVLDVLTPTPHRLSGALELIRHQARLLTAARVHRVDQHTIDVRFTLTDETV
ncbi:hypothetical protein [Alloactinosynnema sp. L-07]|uniref:hypothetical protein n=1 Tax=Alloactinosynnema sp. L-07 TaxID=1653480 RepID=UPI00065F0033|nr:hypothetical protein [Alloactinosynnema sp. L-07]CRK56971.1 hypothetical protein [Alloactinosynnema sp. L-07]